MPALEMSIHCLCLLVPDEDTGTVHVLMPRTHPGHHRHVAHVLDDSFSQREGRSMEGLVLRLGPAGNGAGAADLRLVPTRTPKDDAAIVNLNPLAGVALDRGILTDTNRISCRIELRAGQLHEVFSEASWEIGDDNQRIAMATKVVWRIDEVTEDHLEWTPFGGGGTEPFASLYQLADPDTVIRFAIYHVTPDALPPSPVGTLNPEQVKHHFRSFYHMYGVHNPSDTKLPRNPRLLKPADKVAAELAAAARKRRDLHAIDQLARLAELAAKEDEARSMRELLFFVRDYNCPTGTGRFV